MPGDRVRVHLCWGNYEGPHHLDIELEKIFDDVIRLKASALRFEASNPRHAHEWAVGRANADKIPDDKILIPGVLDTTANYIEYPALVAERLGNFVDIVGADRVIAGTDCGFGTWAGFGLSTRRFAGPSWPRWPRARSSPRARALVARDARRVLDLRAIRSFRQHAGSIGAARGRQQHLPAQPAGLVELVGAGGLVERQHLGDARAQPARLEVGGQRAQLLGVRLDEHGLEADAARGLGPCGGRVKTRDPAVAQGGGGVGAERDGVEDRVDGPDGREVGLAGRTSLAPSEATQSSSS